jgi:hypothetical protein
MDYSPKTAPLEISSVTPRPRDGQLIKLPVRNCFRHLLVFPPFYEFHGISACSLRSPDHVEANSPPTVVTRNRAYFLNIAWFLT